MQESKFSCLHYPVLYTILNNTKFQVNMTFCFFDCLLFLFRRLFNININTELPIEELNYIHKILLCLENTYKSPDKEIRKKSEEFLKLLVKQGFSGEHTIELNFTSATSGSRSMGITVNENN